MSVCTARSTTDSFLSGPVCAYVCVYARVRDNKREREREREREKDDKCMHCKIYH